MNLLFMIPKPPFFLIAMRSFSMILFWVLAWSKFFYFNLSVKYYQSLFTSVKSCLFLKKKDSSSVTKSNVTPSKRVQVNIKLAAYANSYKKDRLQLQVNKSKIFQQKVPPREKYKLGNGKSSFHSIFPIFSSGFIFTWFSLSVLRLRGRIVHA
jgi:hypothetical protein